VNTTPRPARTIALNCDLGEIPELVSAGVDESLIASVGSINVACGGHAGDEATIDRLVAAAARRGVHVGAHPGYPDRANFGRVHVDMPIDDIERTVREQVGAVETAARRHRVPLTHVKPHGALYHDAAVNPATAAAVWRGVQGVAGCREAALVGPSGSACLALWRSLGARTLAEAFADRHYEPDGTLRSRTLPDALITSPLEASAQAVRIALYSRVISSSGTLVELVADTLCVHADTPGAVEIAGAVRAALERTGISVR
jgi:UPF0271 protein